MKRIPVGAWTLALNLADKTTEESLQQFLAERGVDLPIENISINVTAKGTSALVSIDNECGTILVNWAINAAMHFDRRVVFTPWQARGHAHSPSGIGYYGAPETGNKRC